MSVNRKPGLQAEEVRGRMAEVLPTVRDVAQLAGVSQGTVSKALNGRGQLREETRQRVRRRPTSWASAPITSPRV